LYTLTDRQYVGRFFVRARLKTIYVTIQHFFPKKPKKVLDTVFLKISIFRYHLCGFFETPLLSAIAAPHDIQPFFAVAG